MEVMLKKFTNISKSPKKINIPDDDDVGTNLIQLQDLPNIQDFQKVTVDIKVVNITEPLTVTGGKVKQDVTVSDSTTTACLTLWNR